MGVHLLSDDNFIKSRYLISRQHIPLQKTNSGLTSLRNNAQGRDVYGLAAHAACGHAAVPLLIKRCESMQSSEHASSYSKPAMFFHWATAVLILVGLFAINIRGPRGTDSRLFWNSVHIWAGSLILALSIMRLLWKLWHGAPAELAHSPVQLFMARLVHLALYLLIFVQPLLGIAMVNTGGNAVTLAGTGWHIQWFSKDPVAHRFLHDAHFLIGNAAYWLIGLHAFAALAHHVVFQDATLTRMSRFSRDR